MVTLSVRTVAANGRPLDAGPKGGTVKRGLAARGCYATALSFYRWFRFMFAFLYPVEWKDPNNRAWLTHNLMCFITDYSCGVLGNHHVNSAAMAAIIAAIADALLHFEELSALSFAVLAASALSLAALALLLANSTSSSCDEACFSIRDDSASSLLCLFSSTSFRDDLMASRPISPRTYVLNTWPLGFPLASHVYRYVANVLSLCRIAPIVSKLSSTPVMYAKFPAFDLGNMSVESTFCERAFTRFKNSSANA